MSSPLNRCISPSFNHSNQLNINEEDMDLDDSEPEETEISDITEISPEYTKISSALKGCVDFDKIARRTPGFTGAYLHNLMNEVAIIATKRELKEISKDEIVDDLEKIIAAQRRKTLLFHKRKRSLLRIMVIHPSVIVIPVGYSGQSHGRSSYSSDDLPKAVVMTLDLMNSSISSMDFHPIHQHKSWPS